MRREPSPTPLPFRVHFAGGEARDVDACSSEEAQQLAVCHVPALGAILKTKRVREATS